MILQVKNMVCKRCIMVVSRELDALGFNYSDLQLGSFAVQDDTHPAKLTALDEVLKPLGFELIDARKTGIVEKIKNAVVQLVHYTDEQPRQNLSVYLSEQLHYDYKHLSHLFSESEGSTIEQYMIRQKIERAKELLQYNELSLSEIADRLGYSSVAYLSNQFRKISGYTPGDFKRSIMQRQPIEEL